MRRACLLTVLIEVDTVLNVLRDHPNSQVVLAKRDFGYRTFWHQIECDDMVIRSHTRLVRHGTPVENLNCRIGSNVTISTLNSPFVRIGLPTLFQSVKTSALKKNCFNASGIV